MRGGGRGLKKNTLSFGWLQSSTVTIPARNNCFMIAGFCWRLSSFWQKRCSGVQSLGSQAIVRCCIALCMSPGSLGMSSSARFRAMIAESSENDTVWNKWWIIFQPLLSTSVRDEQPTTSANHLMCWRWGAGQLDLLCRVALLVVWLFRLCDGQFKILSFLYT